MEAEIGTYAVIRIQEPTQSLPAATTFWQARVRFPDQSRTRGTRVLPWQMVPLDSVLVDEDLDSDTKLRSELASYVHLPDNWDGEGAVAPSQAAIDDALTFLDGRPSDIPLPRPDQGCEGEVGVYWDNRAALIFAEATFDGDGTFAYFAAHGVPGPTADKCGEDGADVSKPWPEDMLRILRQPGRA